MKYDSFLDLSKASLAFLMQTAAVYLLGFACSIKKNSSWLFLFDLYSYENNLIGNSKSSWYFKREQKYENSVLNAENDNFNYKVIFFFIF